VRAIQFGFSSGLDCHGSGCAPRGPVVVLRLAKRPHGGVSGGCKYSISCWATQVEIGRIAVDYNLEVYLVRIGHGGTLESDERI